MPQDTEVRSVSLSEVRRLVTANGYEAKEESDDVLRIRDVETGLVIRSVLVDNILFNALNCVTVSEKALTPEVLRRMLRADNGISTSSFQLYEHGDGRVSVSLNNFCKLLEMGVDDADDVLSCLEFLAIDAFAAHQLLGDLS